MKVKIEENGYMPMRAHFDDAGIDFRTPEEFTLKPLESHVVDLNVKIQIPVGYFGKLESKSGLMVNHGVICMGGVIDSGFRGNIKVRMMNLSDKSYTFHKGDKLVQMVLIPVLLADIESVDTLDASESGRETSGYGSTGR